MTWYRCVKWTDCDWTELIYHTPIRKFRFLAMKMPPFLITSLFQSKKKPNSNGMYISGAVTLYSRMSGHHVSKEHVSVLFT